MSRKITMGISNPLNQGVPGAAVIGNSAHYFKMNYNPVTGASNTTSGSPTSTYVDPADIVSKANNAATIEDEEGLIKSRSTLEARRDAAFDKDPNSAKTARLNRRFSSYKEGTERRAGEINKTNPQTGIGRAIKGVFGKNNFTNSAGEKVSRKEAVEERQQQELNKLNKPSPPPSPITPLPSSSTPSSLSSKIIATGSQGKKCTGGRVLDPVTGKCK